MVFPEFGIYGMGHQMRNFMRYFTSYSYMTTNKFDDAPDSIAMFAEKFIRKSSFNDSAVLLQL